jgi:hypothetical protein
MVLRSGFWGAMVSELLPIVNTAAYLRFAASSIGNAASGDEV